MEVQREDKNDYNEKTHKEFSCFLLVLFRFMITSMKYLLY
jgi:hypothetical protein